MKTLNSIIAMAVLVMASINLNAAWEENPARFSLSFYGGMNYLKVGGINYYLDQINIYEHNKAEKYNETLAGNLKEVHWGTDWAGEIGVRLNRHWLLAVGSGFMSAEVGPATNWLDLTNGHPDWHATGDTTFRVVPLTLNLRCSFHFRGRLFFVAGAGPGYYMINLKHAEIHSWANGSSSQIYDVKGNTIGAQGSLGLEFRVSRHFSLLLEGTGRYAVCDSLTGAHGSGSGTLYFYKFFGAPTLCKLMAAPSGNNYSDVREVKANASGWAVRMGVRINI
jgi:hypothetical protein